MRLLLTLDFPPERGGIQRYLSGIVAHTFTKDDAVLVGCGRIPWSKTTGFPCPVTHVSTVLSRWNKKWSLFPLLLRCLKIRQRQGETLVIDCGNAYAGIVAWLISLFMPVRYCVYAYGSELLGLHRSVVTGFLLKNVLSGAMRVIAISSYTTTLVHGICPAAKVDIVFPKIDVVPEKYPKSSTSPAERDLTAAILCVGRLVPHKGHDVLLEAVARLPADLHWRCVIAGCGPQFGKLTRRCRDLGISDRVTIKTGLSDAEMELEYHTATLFALPTVSTFGGTEGFGIVLLEAMAHGLPIIASNTGGIAEVLDNGSCGVLVAPGDPAALCDSIRLVAGERVLRERLVSAAQERLRKLYVWQ
jgi:glycosyltransferase involved in cell wall biosynthesis